MNKIELIQALKDAADLSKPESEKVVNLFFMEMTAALAKGERVKIKPKNFLFLNLARNWKNEWIVEFEM